MCFEKSGLACWLGWRMTMYWSISSSSALACNLKSFTMSRFPCFLLVRRVWDISSGIGPCFPLVGELFKLHANAELEEIDQYIVIRQPSQQANPLFSKHNYTPLVISGNYKNNQLTLLSQRKLTFNQKIYVQ